MDRDHFHHTPSPPVCPFISFLLWDGRAKFKLSDAKKPWFQFQSGLVRWFAPNHWWHEVCSTFLATHLALPHCSVQWCWHLPTTQARFVGSPGGAVTGLWNNIQNVWKVTFFFLVTHPKCLFKTIAYVQNILRKWSWHSSLATISLQVSCQSINHSSHVCETEAS